MLLLCYNQQHPFYSEEKNHSTNYVFQSSAKLLLSYVIHVSLVIFHFYFSASLFVNFSPLKFNTFDAMKFKFQYSHNFQYSHSLTVSYKRRYCNKCMIFELLLDIINWVVHIIICSHTLYFEIIQKIVSCKSNQEK